MESEEGRHSLELEEAHVTIEFVIVALVAHTLLYLASSLATVVRQPQILGWRFLNIQVHRKIWNFQLE